MKTDKIRQDLLDLANRTRKEIPNYNPKIFKGMLLKDDFIYEMRKLLRPQNSYGLDVLAEHGRLDLSLEQYVIDDVSGVFKAEDKQNARKKLDGWKKKSTVSRSSLSKICSENFEKENTNRSLTDLFIKDLLG